MGNMWINIFLTRSDDSLVDPSRNWEVANRLVFI